MFKDKTVFVIGAGASHEFGLPIGAGLTQRIKTNCDFDAHRADGPAANAMRRHFKRLGSKDTLEQSRQTQARVDACHQIRDGIESADSIDEYIFRYADKPLIAEMGKLQIAYAISNAENESTLSVKSGFREERSRADNTWIWAFTKSLISGVKAADVKKIGRNITIICFNYDRCIEHYLEHALCRSFHGMTEEEARSIVNNIQIIHPYGTLGDLERFPFGNHDQFAQMAENLVTWSETIKDPEIVNDISRAIRFARRIVFMGFAFANQNMQLLNSKPTELNYNGPRVYSTAFKIPRENEESLSLMINALYSTGVVDNQLDNIHFQYDAKCKEFFDIHRLNLVA